MKKNGRLIALGGPIAAQTVRQFAVQHRCLARGLSLGIVHVTIVPARGGGARSLGNMRLPVDNHN